MNTINMRQLLMKTSIVGSMIFGLMSAAKADRIGNGDGDGDGAFALAKFVEENPGLSEREILIKAFNESYGQKPEFFEVKRIREGNDMNMYRRMLSGNHDVIFGSLFDVKNKEEPIEWEVVSRDGVAHRGRLLPKKIKETAFEIHSARAPFASGFKSQGSPSGLLLTPTETEPLFFDLISSTFQFIEFRQV